MNFDVFEVTRDALLDGKQFQMLPIDGIEYYGKVVDKRKDGIGFVLAFFKLGKNGKHDNANFQSHDKSTIFPGIQVHIGGLYFNKARKKDGYAASTGCITLNGADAGWSGHDRFITSLDIFLTAVRNIGGASYVIPFFE